MGTYVAGLQHLSNGWQELIKPPSPAFGANFTRVVPVETYERVVALRYQLATSAVVGNRFPQIRFADQDGSDFLRSAGAGTIVASASVLPSLVVNGAGNVGGTTGDTFGTLPDLLLPPLYSISIAVAGIDAGDQISNIRMIIQRIPADVASGDRYYEVLEAWRAMAGG